MFESINVRVAYDISFANCKLQKSTQYNYSHRHVSDFFGNQQHQQFVLSLIGCIK